MTLDFTNPGNLMRRDGGAFVILHAAKRIGYVEYCDAVHWTEYGSCFHGPNHVNDWDLIPIPEAAKAWPQDGDDYYIMNLHGKPMKATWNSGWVCCIEHKFRGDIYRTYEDAQRAADAIREVLGRINDNGVCRL